jgi:thioredoxin 2
MDTTSKATVRCMLCGTLNRVDLSRVDQQPTCGECKRPMLLDRPMPVTDADFEQIIGDADVPVVVDFYADWCGPCKMMAPLFDDFAREHRGAVLVAKLDTDRNQVTSRRYDVRGIPTLIVFRGGKEVARQVGAVPRPALEQLLAAGAAGAA